MTGDPRNDESRKEVPSWFGATKSGAVSPTATIARRETSGYFTRRPRTAGSTGRNGDERLGRFDPGNLADPVDDGVERRVDVWGLDLDDQVERPRHRLDLSDARDRLQSLQDLFEPSDLGLDQKVKGLHRRRALPLSRACFLPIKLPKGTGG